MDQHLVDLANGAIEMGKNEIIFADICSGKDGNLLRSLTQERNFPKLHALMKAKPGMTLRAVGLTSADGKEQSTKIFKEEVSFTESQSVPSSKIVVENYAYTVTKNQRIKIFLDNIGVDRLDMCMSTYGLGYFTPANFEQAVTDLADKLSSGGEIFIAECDAVPAGAIRLHARQFGLNFNNLSEKHKLRRLFGSLTNDEYDRFYNLSPEEQVKQYLDFTEKCLEQGYISLDQVKQVMLDIRVMPVHVFAGGVDAYISTDGRKKIESWLKL